MTLLFNFATGYIGVIRYSNGTDLEIQRWHNSTAICGDSTVVGEPYTVLDDLYCGYMCSNTHSSYWTNDNTGLSCLSDEKIRQEESKTFLQLVLYMYM